MVPTQPPYYHPPAHAQPSTMMPYDHCEMQSPNVYHASKSSRSAYGQADPVVPNISYTQDFYQQPYYMQQQQQQPIVSHP